MNKKRPIVTYIIDGKEETKIINMFNKKLLMKKLFSNLYIYSMFSYIEIDLKPEIEYIKLENVDFGADVYFSTESVESVVILDNCIFLQNLSLENGIFEIINPKFKLCNPEIESSCAEDISVKFEENEGKNLPYNIESIDYEIVSSNFSLINAKRIGEFYINSNNVTIINSFQKYFDSLNVFEIFSSNNIIIKESNISNSFRITLDTEKLTLINSSINGIENTPVELSVETMLGNNYMLSSDKCVKIRNRHTFENDIYKVKPGYKKVELTEKELTQKELEKLTKEELLEISKLPMTRNLISDLKAVNGNVEDQIQFLKDSKSDEYIEEINYHNNEINNYNNEINNHKEKIKELEEKSVANSKKLERKLKSKNIGSYY